MLKYILILGDDHKARQDIKKKKTARYLMHAEDIYQKFVLPSSGQQDQKRWHVRNFSEKEKNCLVGYFLFS